MGFTELDQGLKPMIESFSPLPKAHCLFHPLTRTL